MPSRGCCRDAPPLQRSTGCSEMPLYRYQAWDERGRLLKGILEADSQQDLFGQLRAQGLLLKKASGVKRRAWRERKVPLEVLAEFSHQMAFIMRSGVSMVNGMGDLKRQLGGETFSQVLDGLIREVTAGSTLSQAMSRQPMAFPSYYVAVIHAGETAGSLEESFRDMALYLEWLVQLRRQVKQALTYPVIVMLLISIAIAIFITVVVPRLVSFIKELNRPMPVPTQVLVWINELVAENWYILLALAGIGVLGSMVAWRFPSVRFFWDRHKLHLPVLGQLMLEMVLLRFVKYLRVLYRAGIQIHQSFNILQEVVPNRYYRSVMSHIRDRIMEGESLADAMESSGAFPPQIQRNIRVGEQTGTLEEALEQLGIHLGRMIEVRIKRLVSLIEPMLLMLVGGILILVIVSVLWPIYTILGELG